MPDVSFTSNAAKSDKAYVGYVLSKDEAGNFAALVYVDADNDHIDVEGATTDVLLYVLDEDSRYVDRTNGDTIVVYNAILNGEETQIEAKSTAGLKEYTMYSKVTQDSDGYYEADPFNAEDSTNEYLNDANVTGEFEYSNGALTLGNRGAYTVSSDTQIVLVLLEDDKNSSTHVTNVMVDKDADYEVSVNLNGRGLANALRGYDVTAKVYGILADDKTDTSELTALYVVVTNATEIP